MKYNPGYHSSVVRNYRQQYKATFDKECGLQDEQIWNIFDSICAPTSEEQDEWVVAAMQDKESEGQL